MTQYSSALRMRKHTQTARCPLRQYVIIRHSTSYRALLKRRRRLDLGPDWPRGHTNDRLTSLAVDVWMKPEVMLIVVGPSIPRDGPEIGTHSEHQTRLCDKAKNVPKIIW